MLDPAGAATKGGSRDIITVSRIGAFNQIIKREKNLHSSKCPLDEAEGCAFIAHTFSSVDTVACMLKAFTDKQTSNLYHNLASLTTTAVVEW